MKKLWALILMFLGIADNSFADCYENAMEFDHSIEAESIKQEKIDEYLVELEDMRDYYDYATTWEKSQMQLRAINMAKELESLGYNNIVMAAEICVVCQGGPSRR